jgi:GTP pyrophosphokinase
MMVTGDPLAASRTLLAQAQAFAAPWLSSAAHASGENAMDHALAVAALLRDAQAPPEMEAAAVLAAVVQLDDEAAALVAAHFGDGMASLIDGTRQLARLESQLARLESKLDAAPNAPHATSAQNTKQRTERVRRMLLAFSRDLRGVLLHLASRLQNMRWHAQNNLPLPPAQATEALELLAPLANRLGVWSLKWELEDLAFRTLQPNDYADVARLVEATRDQRMKQVAQFQTAASDLLAQHQVPANVAGRAKHLYSVWRKMQGKRLTVDQVLDLRAVRIIVPDLANCYAAVSRVHERWPAMDGEYDDYIARPKSNGYQSLHTVVLDDDARPVEVQIRTQAMHDHAEHGVAAHWAYKEAGTKGYAGHAAPSTDTQRVAGARKAMLQQLLAWEQDVTAQDATAQGGDGQAQDGAAPVQPSDRVYVFTPLGAVVDLPLGATAIDFAYALHTSLGHRCRGAKLDGAMVPLATPLKNGQTVEVVVGKDGGPSLDWLNDSLGYLASPRSRSKVRAWFNTQVHAQTVARGRERLERTLQRLGRTAAKHVDIANKLHQADVDHLYAALGKDELPLRDVELLFEQAAEPVTADAVIAERIAAKVAPNPATKQGSVLVVGVDSLMTGLARCCRPAPPDAISGFVTRTKGVAIHRTRCTNFQHMATQSPQRIVAVAWGGALSASTSGKDGAKESAKFAVDVSVEANDRPGLLRDVTEVFAKAHINVMGVQYQTVRNSRDRVAWMTLTLELASASALPAVLALVQRVEGVRHARRK